MTLNDEQKRSDLRTKYFASEKSAGKSISAGNSAMQRLRLEIAALEGKKRDDGKNLFYPAEITELKVRFNVLRKSVADALAAESAFEIPA